MHGKAPAKQIAGLRIDFHHSIVRLARYAEMHKPALIFGEGQGALIALGYSKPALVERALQSRNVQQSECGTLAAAWGGVRAIIIHETRVSRLRLQQDKLRTAVPELYEKPENPVVGSCQLGCSLNAVPHSMMLSKYSCRSSNSVTSPN